MNVTLAQLRLVLAVAENESFTVAAEQAVMSQPALSRAVKEVERVVGARLFDRTTRSVRLTADGREFVRVADEIVRAVDGGLGRFQAYRRGMSGTVTVAALPALAACIMPFVCRRFAASRPDVDVRIVEGDTAEVLADVLSGRADIAVTEAPRPTEGLELTLIGEDEMVAVSAPGHPVTAGKEVSWREWATYPVVGLGDSRRADEACRHNGVDPHRAYVADSAATVVGLVAAGLGVAAMPLSALPLTAHRSVVVTPLVQPRLVQPLAVVTRTVPALAPPAREFLAELGNVRFDPLHRAAPVQRPQTSLERP
ncbi:LysR family transcriptional regulator [Actinoplanes sp. NPDC049265]|uniref:LysR family transcriptional regulator n=1 Tax=Actinoplanes sp. NPDC049265 TaxID=3363902 RepID=UPI0037116153